MGRRQRDWIARIFSIATAGATPVLAGCNSAPLCNNDIQPTVDGGTVDGTTTCDPPAPTPFQTVRRPFLVGRSMRSAAPQAREDWLSQFPGDDTLDAATRRALAAAWLKDALEEHASVAAFARFSLMALEVGAPPDILADAQRASLDEIRHARSCFGLARRYGATEAGPGPLRVDDALGASSLARLATLTAEEGCVGETLGALLAERQAQVAEGAVQDTLWRITRDEQRHAELAWRAVAWAIRVGGRSIADAVAQSIHEAIAETRAMVVPPLPVDLSAWHAHGRLSCAEARHLAEEGIVDLVLPALAGLSRV